MAQRTIQVPPELHTQLKQLSLNEKKPIYQLIGERMGLRHTTEPVISYNGFPVHYCKECDSPLDSRDTCQNKKCKQFLK